MPRPPSRGAAHSPLPSHTGASGVGEGEGWDPSTIFDEGNAITGGYYGHKGLLSPLPAVQAELDAWNALDAEERRRRTFEREKQALEAKILKAEVDAANRKLGIEPDDPKKKKKDGEESEEEEVPEDEGEVDFVRRLRKRHAKTQRRVLEMYRRATSLVYGVSQITLHSNATKVEVALEGLDLFAELP